MHRHRNPQSPSLATFASLLLVASTTFTSASSPPSSSHPECLHTRGRELAASATCGDDGSIAYCFSRIPLSTPPELLTPEVEECFLNAGCNAAEAPIQAFWALRRCDRPPSPADLRRRQQEDLAAIPLPMTIAARQATTTTTTDPKASPSPCSTKSDVPFTSCPVQSTGKDAGKTLRKGCVPTTQPIDVCVEGLICRTDNQGNPSCMRKQTSLGTAGTIVAIFFATAIAAAVFGVCFLCCRERRSQRRLQRAAEAASIAKEAKNSAMLAKKNPGAGVVGRGDRDGEGDVGVPLMGNGGGGFGGVGGDHPALPPLPGQYGGAGAADGGQNPFVDQHDGHVLR